MQALSRCDGALRSQKADLHDLFRRRQAVNPEGSSFGPFRPKYRVGKAPNCDRCAIALVDLSELERTCFPLRKALLRSLYVLAAYSDRIEGI